MKTFTISSNTLLLWSLATLLSCDSSGGKQSVVKQKSQQDSSAVALVADCAPTAFDSLGGKPFSKVEEAKALTKKHRDNNHNIDQNCKKGHAYYFNKELIDSIMNQKRASGIRVYNTRDKGDQDGVIIVAVDGKGNDLIGNIPGQAPTAAKLVLYQMAETSMKCPSNCDGSNRLYIKDY